MRRREKEIKFSNDLKELISQSRSVSISIGYDYIDSWHFILAIYEMPQLLAAQYLNSLEQKGGKSLRALISDSLGVKNHFVTGDMPLTKRAEGALKISYLEAKAYLAREIDSSIFLLSILRDSSLYEEIKIGKILNYQSASEYFAPGFQHGLVIGFSNNSKLHIKYSVGNSAFLPLTQSDSEVIYRYQLLVHNYWNNILKELEELINYPNLKESELQLFLEKYPELLLEDQYKEIIPQAIVTCKERDWRSDFILVPKSQYDFCKILELKLPKAKTIRNSVNGHIKFSSELFNAIGQMKDYRNAFKEKKTRDNFSMRYQTEVYNPDLQLIIGRDPNILAFKNFQEIQRREQVKVDTWDSFLIKTRERLT